MRKSFID